VSTALSLLSDDMSLSSVPELMLLRMLLAPVLSRLYGLAGCDASTLLLNKLLLLLSPLLANKVLLIEVGSAGVDDGTDRKDILFILLPLIAVIVVALDEAIGRAAPLGCCCCSCFLITPCKFFKCFVLSLLL